MDLTSNTINSLDDNELFQLLDDIKINIFDDINSSSKLFCKTCNTSDNISEDTSQGIIVCIGCGSILSELFDISLESRQYENDSGHVARCNAITNHFLPQSSLGTTIGGMKRNKVRLLHNWSAMPYRERSLNAVLKQIQAKCAQAKIMKCIEDDAKILYKNISESKHLYGKNSGKTIIIRGTNRRALVASCVFYACKKRKDNTRSPKEIAKLFDLSYKDITKGYKIFHKFMLKQANAENKISNPEDFITRYCRELHIKNKYIEQAIQIAKNIQKLDIASTHTPFSIATSSIILMVDLNKFNIDRKYIAKKFNVSDVTIIKTYKKIEKYKNILTNDQLCDQLAKKMEEERKMIHIPEKLKSIYKSNIIKEEDNQANNDNKKNDENDDNEIDSSDDSNSSNNSIFEKRFDIHSDNLDEYISYIEADLYDKLSQTDDEYDLIFNNR